MPEKMVSDTSFSLSISPLGAAVRKTMTEKYVFADADLPFHVWVKEGNGWVLRNAAKDLQDGSPEASGGASRASGPTAAGGSR
jgi:hypothetical protein